MIILTDVLRKRMYIQNKFLHIRIHTHMIKMNYCKQTFVLLGSVHRGLSMQRFHLVSKPRHHPNTRKTCARTHTHNFMQKTTGVLSTNLDPQAHFKHIPQVTASASPTALRTHHLFSTSLHNNIHVTNLHGYKLLALLISSNRLTWNLVLLPLYKQPLPGFIIRLFCICWCGLEKRYLPKPATQTGIAMRSFSVPGGQRHRPLASWRLVCGRVQILLSAEPHTALPL